MPTIKYATELEMKRQFVNWKYVQINARQLSNCNSEIRITNVVPD